MTTQEIARAFLVPEPTVAQRIVRAKRTLTEARVPFEVLRGPDLRARLSSVLEVIYLIFNEGYSATAGEDWMRPALCEDALRLGRILAGLVPNEPEVHGLVAFMEIQASRVRARVGPAGEPILLLDQDRTRWDHVLVAASPRSSVPRKSAMLSVAPSAPTPFRPPSPPVTLARVLRRKRTGSPSPRSTMLSSSSCPVVELNRAVALSMAFGPQAGLELIDRLASEPSLKAYHLLPSVRGDLFTKLGRFDEACAEFERAATLTRNVRERNLLFERAGRAGPPWVRPSANRVTVKKAAHRVLAGKSHGQSSQGNNSKSCRCHLSLAICCLDMIITARNIGIAAIHSRMIQSG